jgi:transposase, IS30 family
VIATLDHLEFVLPQPRRSWKPRGIAPDIEKREQYLALVSQGVSNSAACRTVGINRRTGTRWRYGRTVVNRAGVELVYEPIADKTRQVSARFLSEQERVRIADLLVLQHSIRAIAIQLHRSPSTISREIGRNSDPETGRYHPFHAHRRAVARRARPKGRRLAGDTELGQLVQTYLASHWSPEQIAQTILAEFPDRTDLHLVHETIYRALYHRGADRLQREPTIVLRTGRARRRPRRRVAERQHRFANPMVMIDQRPAEVADRSVAGHWEGDLIMGSGNRSAIGTLVERTTGYTVLLHLPRGHGAEQLRLALTAAITELPAHLMRSITWDQGIEMARHAEFTAATNVPVYFCEPAKPWQRGINENTNGLLRQYFPKSSNLAVHTATHLATVAAQLNARPRKRLHWMTPQDHLATLLSPAA